MAAVNLDELEVGIARITLNRPERLNAIDGALINGMDVALDGLTDGDWRVAIMTGAGRGFCAGADLSGTGEVWTKPAKTEFKTQYDAQMRLTGQMTRLYELPILVVAAEWGGRWWRPNLRPSLRRTRRRRIGAIRVGVHQGRSVVDGHGPQLFAAEDHRCRTGA